MLISLILAILVIFLFFRVTSFVLRLIFGPLGLILVGVVIYRFFADRSGV